MKEKFIRYLEQVTPISNGLKEDLKAQICGPYTFKKGTLLLREGDISENAYFIVRGMARMYYTIKDKEITSRFIPENSIAIPYYSYFTQHPSYESMDLVEPSQVLCICRADFESLYERHPELHNLIRQQLAKALIHSDERAMMIRKLSAKERYEALLENFPSIFLRASVQQIASFLGLSRETLTRIRSGVKCDEYHKV
ncbi:Crp/Fnr family transcriptional regulator [Rufibacter tibetensis]|uniref:Cyclic nucleotide-binding domain-containing protein n=1 Tax=Rufibacter tibetensis TaxID=512763 RepID=A0A0P0CQD3_9BACT|nr:Crp/Fnr family transcriptional regulator [Rufibacter tibetensis]ALI99593.1 hypothetical protein DC20_12195 [Rufibacter tibetensis]